MTNPTTCFDRDQDGTRLTVQWFEETPVHVTDGDRVRVHVRRTLSGGQWDETTIWMTVQEAILMEAGLLTAIKREACCVPVEEEGRQ